MSSNEQVTGKQLVAQQLLSHAAELSGPAAALAGGASATKVAADTLKDIAIQKLVGPTAVFAGGMIGVLKTVRSIVKETRIIEKGLENISGAKRYEGIFETLLGSATLAKQRVKELYEFTARSPFEFKGVAEANRILEALTSGGFSGAEAMKKIGDAAAASGQPIQDVATKYGKIYAAINSGRSFDKSIQQLQFMGLISDDLAYSLENLASTGANTAAVWSAVEQSLNKTTGGMKNEMETVEGLNNQLNNASQLMETAFGSSFVDAQVNSLHASIEATKNLTPLVAQIGKDWSLLPNIMSGVKTSIVDSTLASKGFAGVLGGLYQVATGIGTALAFGGIAHAGKTALTAVFGANGLRSTINGGLKTSRTEALKPGGALANAKETFTNGKGMLDGGEFLAGGIQMMKGKLSELKTETSLFHAEALTAARATGSFNVATYIGGVALGGFKVGIMGARLALGMLTGGLSEAAIALLSNPFSAALVAIGAVAFALYRAYNSAMEANKAYKELTDSLDATNKKLREQASAIRTLDDWRSSIQSITEEIKKMNAELDNTPVTKDNLDEIEAKRAARSRLQVLLARTQRMDPSKLVPSREEEESLKVHSGDARSLAENAYQDQLAQAKSPEERMRIREAHRAEQARRAESGRSSEEARLAFERSAGGQRVGVIDTQQALAQSTFDAAPGETREQKIANAQAALAEAKKALPSRGARGNFSPELRRNLEATVSAAQERLDRINDYQNPASLDERRKLIDGGKSDVWRSKQRLDDLGEGVKSGKNTAAEYADALQQHQRLVDDSKSHAQSRAQAEDDARKNAQEARDLELQKINDLYDGRIADAKTQGKGTGRLEYQRQMDLLDKQAEQAEAQGDYATSNRLQAQQDQLTADRYGPDSDLAKGRRGVALSQDRDKRLMAGDVKGAQTDDDLQGLLDQRDKYKALGLSQEQADTDFKNNIVASAALQAPRIVADSLQSVGGGGGYAASDPVAAAQERVRRLQEAANTKLDRIVQLLSPDPSDS